MYPLFENSTTCIAILLLEGWIVVVGVDNILEHFIYRVLTKHQRQNRGVAAKKGLFFAYIAGYRDVSVLMGGALECDSFIFEQSKEVNQIQKKRVLHVNK